MRSLSIAIAAGVVLFAGAAQAAPSIGQPAPAFTAKDAAGKTHRLADYRGKTVVLEWVNEGCPYVRRQYDAGAMQKTQRDAIGRNAVWLTIASSAPGQQGYLDSEAAKRWQSKEKAGSTALLLDSSGVIGRAYDAKTTPHMFVIDPQGKVAYMGAIDSKPTPRGDFEGVTNYVVAALDSMKAGKAPSPAVTKPYGCDVKY